MGAFLASAPALAASQGVEKPLVDFSGDWTQFIGAAVAGSGDDAPRYGGRLDGYADIDGEKLGLWDGLSIHLHGEFVYGQNVNRIGARVLLPINTALNFPASNKEDFDLSYKLVQKFGRVRLQIGKINLLDEGSVLPIVSGGGREGFQNTGLAAPPALLAAPKIFGGILTVPTRWILFNVGVWTPDDYTHHFGPDRLFHNGVNVMLVATVPIRPAGLRGFQHFSIFATSKRGRDASDSEIQRPPEIANLPQLGAGGYHLKYSFQQYLWQDKANPARGWGMFGHFGLSFGTPGILGWSMAAGVSGSVPIASRPLDRFGIGYFRFALTKDVIHGLAPLVALEDEQGVEVFYTAEVAHGIRLTAMTQVVDSVLRNGQTAVFVGGRARVIF